jgi:hypothetical protein
MKQQSFYIRINAKDTSILVTNDGLMYRVSKQGVFDDTFTALNNVKG